MQTNITSDWANTFVSADIVNLNLAEYTSIMLYLRKSLERIEENINKCKAKEHLNRFVEGREEEYKQLKNLIKKLEG